MCTLAGQAGLVYMLQVVVAGLYSIANQFGHASGNLQTRATRSHGSPRDSLLPLSCLEQMQTDLQY